MFEFSGLDWTIVRATMLTNAAYTGRVHIDFERNATGGDWTLGRADYAMTLLDVVENPQMSGKALGVGGAKAGEQLIDIRQAESSMISQHWTEPQWMVSGVIDAPVEQVWRALIESNSVLSEAQKRVVLSDDRPPQMVITVGQPSQGQMRIEIDKAAHTITLQGEWWYRGTHQVMAHDGGSRDHLRGVQCRARGDPLAGRTDAARTRRAHEN